MIKYTEKETEIINRNKEYANICIKSAQEDLTRIRSSKWHGAAAQKIQKVVISSYVDFIKFMKDLLKVMNNKKLTFKEIVLSCVTAVNNKFDEIEAFNKYYRAIPDEIDPSDEDLDKDTYYMHLASLFESHYLRKTDIELYKFYLD